MLNLLHRKERTMKQQRKLITLFLALFISILFCGSSVYAQKSPKDKFIFPPLNPIKMPKVERVELGNGLELFLVEDHEYPTIDMRAMVRLGSVLESASKIGLASITGQVLRAGGTASMTGDQIDKELETMAAYVSTGIGLTSGYIMVSVLKEDIDRALEILADILLNPAFQEEKVNLARIREKTAISRRNDEVGEIAYREFQKLIYGKDSPYARHPEYATIEAITRQDIVDYYKKYFFPNNTIMAVWGDFSPKDMVAKIEKALGEWKGTEADQSNIMLGHIGGLMDNPDYPALSVMNSILSWDRMFKKIRTDEGLAYSVWGYYGANYQVPGIFSCEAQTKSESTVYAIELMLKELKRIREEEVSSAELARAKDEYLNSFVFNFDSRAKIVNRLMTYAFFGYPLDFMDRVKTGVEKVTKEDVLRVAKKYLRPDKVQILVVGKKEDFDKPLATLGEVNVIDISIPPLKPNKKTGN